MLESTTAKQVSCAACSPFISHNYPLITRKTQQRDFTSWQITHLQGLRFHETIHHKRCSSSGLDRFGLYGDSSSFFSMVLVCYHFVVDRCLYLGCGPLGWLNDLQSPHHPVKSVPTSQTNIKPDSALPGAPQRPRISSPVPLQASAQLSRILRAQQPQGSASISCPASSPQIMQREQLVPSPVRIRNPKHQVTYL